MNHDERVFSVRTSEQGIRGSGSIVGYRGPDLVASHTDVIGRHGVADELRRIANAIEVSEAGWPFEIHVGKATGATSVNGHVVLVDARP
jgi:hypothetical protein